MSTSNKIALVCGAGGFIGYHLVRRLKREGFGSGSLISNSRASARPRPTTLRLAIFAIRIS